MKAHKILALCLALLLLLSACGQSEEDKLYDELTQSSAAPEPESSQASSAPEEDDTDISGTLTLKTPDEFYWKEWIKHFNKKYPNVKVELVGVGTERADYATQTVVELMGGEAPADLVDMYYLPYFDCLESGVFENLLTYMDEDPRVNKDELYTNILDAVTYKDNIAGLPLAFTGYTIRLNKAMLEAAGVTETPEATSFPEMMDWYNKAVEAGAATPDTHFMAVTYNPYTCFTLEYHRYLNEKEGLASFDDPSFAETLTAMKTVNWSLIRNFEPEYEPLKEMELDSGVFALDRTQEFVDPSMAPLYTETDTCTAAVQVGASDGTLPFDAIVGPVGIPAASENKELAWRFLRFFLSEMELEGQQPYLGDYFGPTPLNRRNAMELTQGVYGDDEKAVNMVDEFCGRLNALSVLTTNEIFYKDMVKIFNEYFVNDLISPQECGEKIQDRAYIFLHE